MCRFVKSRCAYATYCREDKVYNRESEGPYLMTLFFAVRDLEGSVKWIYDATMAAARRGFVPFVGG